MTQVDLVVRDDAVSYEKQVVALHGMLLIFNVLLNIKYKSRSSS
jgi:hypothetical protein